MTIFVNRNSTHIIEQVICNINFDFKIMILLDYIRSNEVKDNVFPKDIEVS